MSNEQENAKTREEQIIEAHKQAIIFTGKISEFHVNNLEKWPFIIFDDDIMGLNIRYDFNTPGHEEYEAVPNICPGYVEYDLQFRKGVKVKDAKKKLEILTNWVKSIFWQETEVRFKRNGRKWQVK